MSIWNKTVDMPIFLRQNGDIETDVLVIGGGISGVLCAHALKERGIDTLLVEGRNIGGGTTGGTTAVVTAQHGEIYSKIIKYYGENTARLYYEANMEGFKKYRKLAEKYNFDFEEKPSYIYSLAKNKSLEKEASIVRGFGGDAQYTESMGLPFETAAGVRFAPAAQMHPLKLLRAISKGLNIRENTWVKDIKGTTAYTDTGKIRANKIVVAAHYPFLSMKGGFPLKLYQKRSFVIALRNVQAPDGMFASIEERGIYLRSYRKTLIVGGGDLRTGTGNDGFNIVRRFIAENFPAAYERAAWAAQDCMSLDGIPYIGRYSKNMDNVFVITGFNEWGMTSAMVASDIIADMICGVKNRFTEVFYPGRAMQKKQLAVNINETLKNFLKPSRNRCTHMGCVLHRNYAEKTWDCPCHGSRFNKNGEVVDNPAVRCKKKKSK